MGYPISVLTVQYHTMAWHDLFSHFEICAIRLPNENPINMILETPINMNHGSHKQIMQP